MTTHETIYITFGSQYAREPHPTLPEAHPDGWLELRGFSWVQARAIAHGLTGGAFATDYVGKDFDPNYHPRGPFMVITAERYGPGVLMPADMDTSRITVVGEPIITEWAPRDDEAVAAKIKALGEQS